MNMMLMDGNVEWDFSVPSHGKGDIDGLGGTCKQRVREKTLARTINPQNSIDFAECAAAVCLGITILHCSKTDVEEIKATLENSWHTDNGTIYSIPENLVNVRCLKPHSSCWWKLEQVIDVVWYIESNILGHAKHEPVMDQRGALYKPSK